MADTLPAATGKVLLTISGDISNSNSDKGAEFDYAMLAQLGLIEKQIDTPWTDADSVFTGVLTRKLLELVGANGKWVRAGAANDYSINLPLNDLVQFDTLLGLALNGERLGLRSKGPVWLVYPNDSRPAEPQTEINKRMVWQLTSLQIK